MVNYTSLVMKKLQFNSAPELRNKDYTMKNCCKHGSEYNRSTKRPFFGSCECCNSEIAADDFDRTVRLCPGCRGDHKEQNKIKRERSKIEGKITELNLKLIELQGSCKHPRVLKTYKGDTGNWSKSDDCYWIEFRCPDCGEQWTENQ